MKAMILAAGLGTRLLPYTLKRPKPLFPILNRPLLNLTINRIRNCGFSEIIVNANHLRQQIRDILQHEAGCILQEEEEVLGTGGGLRRALVHFSSEPVLVVNGDIYHTVDYREIYHSHCRAGTDITLVLHDYPRFNDVAVDGNSMVTEFKGPNARRSQREKTLAFTGIHVINAEILRTIPPDTPSCIIDCYRRLLQHGGTIRGHLVSGHFWTDMGTPEDYLKLHADLLTGEMPAYEELDQELADAPFVGIANATVPRDAKLLDWVSIGKGVTIEAGATLQRTVVWDGATIQAGSFFKDSIVT